MALCPLLRLSDNMTFAGALMEPLAVAVYACQRADIKEGFGQKVMVTGAGPVGILIALAAKALEVQDVCILDMNENRLNFAKTIFIHKFNKTLLINSKMETESLSDQVIDILGDSTNINILVEKKSSLNLAIDVTKNSGNVEVVR